MGHEDDDEHKLDVHDSTLCEFEHFWKPYVDFGLAIFSLVTTVCHFRNLKFYKYIKLLNKNQNWAQVDQTKRVHPR